MDGRIHSLKPHEVDAWLQFLAEAFAKKGPNMLEVFQRNLSNDTDFHCGDVLLLGTLSNLIQVTSSNYRQCIWQLGQYCSRITEGDVVEWHT